MKNEVLVPFGSDSDIVPSWKTGYTEVYECACCGSEFKEWTGGRKVYGENEYYCGDCVKSNLHMAFIRDYCETIEHSTKVAAIIISSLVVH